MNLFSAQPSCGTPAPDTHLPLAALWSRRVRVVGLLLPGLRPDRTGLRSNSAGVTGGLTAVLMLLSAASASAQLAPGIGYMFPPGGAAGETVEVVLGGYDWTPDLQVFTLDSEIRLELLGPPGPVIVPEPPYWFGKKARRGPFLLPREIRARLTIPPGKKSGVVRWQVANANGASAAGCFSVVQQVHFTEPDQRGRLIDLPALPLTVSGQIRHIEEVDRYRFQSPRSGPVTISTLARRLKSPLNAVLEVRDETGHLIAGGADTAGMDTAFTFFAAAKTPYTLSLYDLDFRGNRSFVYQVSIVPGPRVVAMIPAAVQRGQTHEVEFVGYGLTGDGSQLDSQRQKITAPSDRSLSDFVFEFPTRSGQTVSTQVPLAEMAQDSELSRSGFELSVPVAVTGVLQEQYGEDRYVLSGTQGDVWAIDVDAQRIGSRLDVSLAVFDAAGKELKRSDDLPGTTDSGLEFPVPSDGKYSIAVADTSGHSGSREAVYRLRIRKATPEFTGTTPEFLNTPIGKKTKLALRIARTGSCDAAIRLAVRGLPDGVTVPDELIVAEKKLSLNIEFTVAAEAAAGASLVTIYGETVEQDSAPVQWTSEPIVLATTLTPPFSVDAEGQDDVTKWPRGTTFPYPVLIRREPTFTGEIVLEMTSRQGRHRQGITGPELTVPEGVERILYPIFLPEWLETTRTSRMVVNGVAKVADPKGKVRYSLIRQKTRMGFLPGGALLKLAATQTEFRVTSGMTLSVPLTVSRTTDLTEIVRIELVSVENSAFDSEPVSASAEQTTVLFPVQVTGSTDTSREQRLTFRATVLKDGSLPVVSETEVVVLLEP